jgi:hypothetical protein
MKILLQYQGSCVENPFPTTKILCDVIDRTKEITKATFFRNCASPGDEVRHLMRRFPNSYTFWKSSYKGKPVYFYEWSRIEFFYM